MNATMLGNSKLVYTTSLALLSSDKKPIRFKVQEVSGQGHFDTS
jgi:hypothetical protein